MDVVGIICEYNPFHNGHIYHLEKIKEMFPDSLIILVLNGYFLERGDISIISKENKTKIALENDIDIVLELPFVYGSQSADTFASKSIEILESFKCNYIVFGSESNDINTLDKIVDYQINKSDEYNKKIKEYMNKGVNYPTAMAKALNIDFEFKANDLLGISYIKAIKENNYNIKPITIKRTNEYLDTLSNDNIISATNIREKIKNNIKIDKYVPKITKNHIETIDYDKLFTLLKYKINTDNDLSVYLDVTEGIDNKLKKVINDVNNYEELILKIKTKRYTYNKLNRMLVHILIGLLKEHNELDIEYVKILGFNKKGVKYLNKIKDNLNISTTPLKDTIIYNYEMKASIIYSILVNKDMHTFDKKNKPLKY